MEVALAASKTLSAVEREGMACRCRLVGRPDVHASV